MEVGKCLRSPPYPLIVVHCLSSFSAEICSAWMTRQVAMLLLAFFPVSLVHAILPAWFNINLQKGSGTQGVKAITCISVYVTGSHKCQFIGTKLVILRHYLWQQSTEFTFCSTYCYFLMDRGEWHLSSTPSPS
jgi:hypothetical protein